MPRPHLRRARARLLAAVAALALLAAACTAATAADRPQIVTVIGQFGGAEQRSFEAMAAAFGAETGIPVQYEAVADVGEELDRRREAAEANDRPSARPAGQPLPDVVLAPSHALPELVEDAQLRALDDVLDTAALDASLLRPVRGEGTVGGQRWAVPFRVAVNGLIWYRPALFEQYGYEVPRTYPDLLALLEDMQDDGIYPWCLGAESAQETGSVLTDWIEDLLLRTAGPEVYDGLVARDVPFDAPEVQRAGELFAELALAPGRVQGGRIGLLTTPETSAFFPMFEDRPGCGLYHAGTDAEALFENMPDRPDVEVGREVAMFPFPPVETRYGQPLTGSADVAGLVTANPGAEALLRWLATPAAASAWIGAGEDAPLLSPYRAFDPAAYPNEAQAAQARLLARTRVFREDASLQMPDWLGSFAFHWELIDWVDGRATLPEALSAIQRSQPRAVDQPTAFPRAYDEGG